MYNVTELLVGSVVFVETDNTIYRVEKCAGASGRRINVRVMSSTGEQPEYLLGDGFETEYTGMSNQRLFLPDVIQVCEPAFGMGMAWEAHPSAGRTHRLTSRVIRVSEVSIPALKDLKLGRLREKVDGKVPKRQG